MRTQSRLAGESALFLIVLGAILVLLNVLGVFGVHLRADATETQNFSLSSGSKRLASSVKDQLEIRAYFSKDLPPPFNATGRYVRDLLAEYRDASAGKITLRVIEPQDDEQKQAAERDGVVRVQDRKLESDSFKIQEGYRGISFHYLDKHEVLSHVETTQGLEYEISQILKRMVGEKTNIGVLGGHEGPTLAKGLQALQEYMPSYSLKEVKADQEIAASNKALLIVHPETPLTEAELRNVDKYVMNGGSLAIYGGGVKVSMDQPQQQGMPPDGPKGKPIDSGLNKLLEKWSVSLGNSVVADYQCSRARMPTNIPGLAIPVPYPPVPVVGFDEQQREHPALFRMNQVALPYPVRIALNDNLKGDKDVKRTILARSTERAWLMEGDSINLQARQKWEAPGYSGPYTLAVALEGKLPSAFASEKVSQNGADGQESAPPSGTPERAVKSVRVLVFGSGYFFHDDFLGRQQAGGDLPTPVALALNSIDWLSQDDDLIAIRAKNVEEPMLNVPQNVEVAQAEMEKALDKQDNDAAKKAAEEGKAAVGAWDARKAAYRWANSLAIPAVFAVFGIIRWRLRRNRSRKAIL